MTLWKGPEKDGITQSLLSRFMVCRERFRVLVIEGLGPTPSFQHRLEYGQMWHTCEECLAQGKDWEKPLKEYAKNLTTEYPTQTKEIDKWYQICKRQFPIYVKFWERHEDVKKRRPLYQEFSFREPIELPSGRIVTLRGKFDSVDFIGSRRGVGIYLQENKTKGDINEQSINQQLLWDLQTGLYLVALRLHLKREGIKEKVCGVRYNVIRRPLSGGRHSIRPHKPTKSNPKGETDAGFYARLASLIEAEPEFFFMRWRVEFTKSDIDRFQDQCLVPILETLWDWWEYISMKADERDTFYNSFHWRHPYGVWNPMNEGRAAEIDEYLNTGSKLGLSKIKSLFKEL